MRLSRTVEYAVQAAVHLAKADSDEPVSCRRLAESEGLPERFLLQILRSLVTHGILRSTRGVEGGYALARAPKDITLLNIIEAIDGPMHLDFPATKCPTSLKKALIAVSDRVRKELTNLSLADLAR